MSKSITRRSFLKGSTVLGVSSILGSSALGWMQKHALAEGNVDIAAVKGDDYFKNTIKAAESLRRYGSGCSGCVGAGFLGIKGEDVQATRMAQLMGWERSTWRGFRSRR